MKPTLDKPIRFLGLEWDEGWEFDSPAVLLEPVIRYSPNGNLESLIEDAQIDLADALEKGQGLTDEDVDREFEWRGWKLARLKRVAREALNGKEFPVRGYRAEEAWARFVRQDDGTVEIVDVDGPAD